MEAAEMNTEADEMKAAEMNMEAAEMKAAEMNTEADEMNMESDEDDLILKDLRARMDEMMLRFHGEKKKLTESELEMELESKAWVETESDVEGEICEQRRLSFELSFTLCLDPEEEKEKEEPPRCFLPYHLGFFDPLSLHELSPEPKKAEMQDFSCNFSREAFSNLSDRLFGVEERNTMKSVYLCLTRGGGVGEKPDCSMSWIIANPNKQRIIRSTGRKVVSQSCIDDVMRNPKSGFPSELSVLTSYGCAVGSSKIFIAGGKCGEFSSNKIFIYDTVSKIWDPPLYMKLKRGEKPTVVIVDDKLLIFGGVIEDIHSHWAESYDLCSRRRSRRRIARPTPQKPLPLCCPGKIVFHAVYPKGNQILIWLDSDRVLSFYYRERLFKEYDGFMSVPLAPQLNNKVVVFEDILFWHYHGTIYARDLLYHVTIPTYTLPRSGFSKVLFRDEVPSSFLAHIGKGKLCLFYQVENHICYFTFSVHVSQSPRATIPLVVLGDSGLLQNSIGWEIMHALEVSPLE